MMNNVDEKLVPPVKRINEKYENDKNDNENIIKFSLELK